MFVLFLFLKLCVRKRIRVPGLFTARPSLATAFRDARIIAALILPDQTMFVHPQFNPVALQLGPLAIHWYGLMYLAGFLTFLWLGRKRIATLNNPKINTKLLDDLLFYGVLGVIFGGRLGYVLFYKAGYYLAHPLEIFAVWQGGMSFHGGFLGVLAATLWLARKQQLPLLQLTDFIVPLVPPGLAFGRLGNFINGELWGRATDVPWAMIFPRVDNLPRHPSELYEFALEGVLLFTLLWLYARKPRPVGAVSGFFLIGYGSFRFLVEFTREPDDFLGLLSLGMSMGQWLSLPMIIAGVLLMIFSYRRAA
jgi:phosphatidylglycerol:prolipoprotein diacylglycerol transferase